MTDVKNTTASDQDEFKRLLESEKFKVPQAGDTVVGKVVSASKAEVKLDIDGILMGVVRGRELYFEAEEYANLKPGDEIEATVIEEENENGEIELSFRYAGHEKAWASLKSAYSEKTNLKVKIVDANRGGLLVKYGQIDGFLPVSQLAPENYPRVSGGDKGKILEKLKSFVGQDFEVKVNALDESEGKLVVSEKDAWNEKQKDVIQKYKIGSRIEGKITAITDFGVFVSFGDNLEGLIHISELAWQRIDDPADLFKVGDVIAAEVINVDGAKIFLSAKKLMKDPWDNVGEKFKVGQTVKGTILKVNPFGLFVKLDDDIHGLAHVSQLNLAPGQKITEMFRTDVETDFEITSIEPRDHRLGLTIPSEKKSGGDKGGEEKTEEKKEVKKKTKKATAKKADTEKENEDEGAKEEKEDEEKKEDKE